MSEKTKEFNLNNELLRLFHNRENSFSNIVVGHVVFMKKEGSNEETEVYHARAIDKTEEECEMMRVTGELNLDNFEIPFEDWTVKDEGLNFKILWCKVSLLSSEKILSKKHMQVAHDLLQAKEIIVSISRRGLIFVCSKDITDYNYFLTLHATIAVQKNNELEFLCEDLFMLEEG